MGAVASPAAGLQVSLLGPVRLVVNGRETELVGLRRRAVLAVLATAHTAIPLDRLADAAWSDTGRPPARNTVQVHVHQLRRLLAPHADRLRHTPAGYRFDPVEVDVRVAEDEMRRARAADRGGDLVGAAAGFRSVVAHFRGEFCADLLDLPYFAAARTFYDTVRLDALEAAVAAGLRLGTPGLVVELEELVSRHPLRERFWGQLMTALYREGRQAEALAGYRRARVALAEGAGVDPGTALRELERAILDQAGTTSLLRVVAPVGPSAAGPALLWVDGTGAAHTRELPGQGRLLVGRDAAVDVVLDWDAAVSRRHAAVEVAGRAVTLCDLGSRNGTFVNGEQVAASRPLRPGDLVRCGDTVLAVTGPGARRPIASVDTCTAQR